MSESVLKVSQERVAGAALDRAVALALGWKPLPGPSPAADESFKRQYWREWDGYLCLPDDNPFFPGAYRLPFPYSKDVGAAIRALDEVGGRVTLTRSMNEWTVTIGHVTCWANTLPLAICLALLDATLPAPLTPSAVENQSGAGSPQRTEHRHG